MRKIFRSTLLGDNIENPKTFSVYTVHTLPQPYEILRTVSAVITSTFTSVDAPEEALKALGRRGAEAGADAVIGFLGLTTGKIATFQVYGTAIKYKK